MRNCKAWYLSAGICFASWIAVGNVFDDVDFRAATEKANPVGYGVDEPIRLTFTLANQPVLQWIGRGWVVG